MTSFTNLQKEIYTIEFLYSYSTVINRYRDDSLSLKGKILFEFQIDNRGRVTSVKIKEKSLDSKDLESRLKRDISRLSFNEIEEGTTTVLYPMSFTFE